MEAWQSLAAETERGFEWLCRGLAGSEPVTLVTNPGNVGDALINVSCYRYLAARFASVSVCSVQDSPRTECVFIAGGGNLIEGLYATIASFVVDRCGGRRLFFFPSSVRGFGGLLDTLSGRVRMICREPVSFSHVAQHLPADSVMLGHDAAFSAAGPLRAAFAGAILRHPPATARFFRDDSERAHKLAGDIDIMSRAGGNWSDLAAAERAVAEVAMILIGFSRIYTDRLHCAILAAILDRYVVLVANSYYKNRAVFEHSLGRFANVRFENEPIAIPTNG